MRLCAVTAAGGPTNAALAQMTGQEWEALVPVPAPRREEETVTLLERVVEAVAQEPQVEHHIVVAPQAVAHRLSHLRVEWVPADSGGGENFLKGLRHCPAERAICTTCDLPVVQTGGLSDFLERCDWSVDVTYSVTERGSMNATFPGYARRYITLQEGRYTGGGLALVDPRAMLARHQLFKSLFGSRKNSFRLAWKMGWPILWGRMTGGTPKARVVKAFSEMAQLRCQTQETDPRWSLDLDSAEDLHYLRWWVRRFPEGL